MTFRGTLLFAGGVLASLGLGWIAFPHAIYTSRQQPVEFSHKIHTGSAGMQCEDCHALREDGSYVGIPPLEQCAGCHTEPTGQTAAEKNFIEKYVTPNREPPWLVNARQPENVWFSHTPHVRLAKLTCARCHGDQGTLDKPRVYQEDRISGYSRDIWGKPVANVKGPTQTGMKMDDCIECHRAAGLEHSCLDCHK